MLSCNKACSRPIRADSSCLQNSNFDALKVNAESAEMKSRKSQLDSGNRNNPEQKDKVK